MKETKFQIRPATSDESSLFYAQSPEKDAELGCIGHVRMDFGHGGASGRFEGIKEVSLEYAFLIHNAQSK